MNIRPYLSVLLMGICFSIQLSAQKRIVVLGSSTAAGTGASSLANSWVGKMTSYYNLNNADGVDTTVFNLSTGGNHSYSIVPSGFTPPPNRPFTDDSRNITAALSLNPDVIIVNLPSNDVFNASNGSWTSYTLTETMDNFRLVESLARAAGVRIFFATTQPRNMAPFYNDLQRQLKDSMNLYFGNLTIDFWTDLTETDGSNTMKASVNSGDGVHVNDIGHNFLYTRVINKGIFGTYIFLPLHLLDFSATLRQNVVKLTWTTELEEPNTTFSVERAADGIQFVRIATLPGTGGTAVKNYTWSDPDPKTGFNYYRIRYTENNKESFSKTIPVWYKHNGISLSKIYTSPAGDQLYYTLNTGTATTVTLRVISSAGATLSQQTQRVTGTTQVYSMPVNRLNTGLYYLQVITENNQVAASPFTKL